jgi:hypothetical protein
MSTTLTAVIGTVVVSVILCLVVVIVIVVCRLRNKRLPSLTTHEVVVQPATCGVQQGNASLRPDGDQFRFTAAKGSMKSLRSIYKQLVMSYESTKDSNSRVNCGDVSESPKEI